MVTNRRSKSGCISCRIRRVKCDEGKPSCLRCQKAKRVCDGYLSDDGVMSRRELVEVVKSLSVIGPVSRALSQEPAGMSRGRSPVDFMYFDFFREATAPGTESFMPSSFWDRHLLQLAHTNRAFWHASIAIGALHRYWESGERDPGTPQARRHAMMHYGQAMAQARTMRSPTDALALSLALVASANMLGRWDDAQTHILAGLKIVGAQNTITTESTEMAGVLSRLDFQAMTYSDSLSPYPYEASAEFTRNDGLLGDGEYISSYAHASSTLMALGRRLMLIQENYSTGAVEESHCIATLQDLMTRLERWEAEMSRFEAQQPGWAQDTAAIAVRMYHAWLRMAMQLTHIDTEMLFDSLLGYYERLVVLGEAFLARQGPHRVLTMSMEPGIVVILWQICHRCRHPSLRRRVLRALRSMKRNEGMWHSSAASAAGQFIIDAEEEGFAYDLAQLAQAEVPWSPASEMDWVAWSQPGLALHSAYNWNGILPIPDHCRAKFVIVASDYPKRILHLTLLKSPVDSPQTLVPTHNMIINL